MKRYASYITAILLILVLLLAACAQPAETPAEEAPAAKQEAPATQPAPTAPAKEAPTTTPATKVTAGPPAIPHTLEGRADCLLCHSATGIKPFPADHAGRTNELCQGCHQPAK